MADLERTYNVPLRKGAMKAPRYKRANKAVKVLREFLERHMKSKTVKLGPYLNSKVLERGRKNIPHHVEVKVVKDKDGIVKAELASAKNLDFLKPKEEKKEKESRLKIPGLGKKLLPSTEKKPKEEKKVEKTEKEKVLEKPDEKVEEKVEKKSAPEPKKEETKAEAVKAEREKVYGRFDKKPKVKEQTKKK